MAAITKYYGLGGLNCWNLLSHSSGVWKPVIKVLAGLDSPAVSFLGLQMVPSHVLTWPFLCSCTSWVSLSHLITTSVSWIKALPLWPYLMWISSLKALSPNIVTLGVKVSAYKCVGLGRYDTIQSLTVLGLLVLISHSLWIVILLFHWFSYA